MKNILFLFLFANAACFCQDTSAGKTPPPPPPPPDKIYDIVGVKEQPTFPGGEQELFKFLRQNISYPKLAKELNLQGKVFTTFVVDKTGEVIDVDMYKGIKPPKMVNDVPLEGEELEKYQRAANELNEEALRVIRMMPKWSPGLVDSKPVKVRYILPIAYTLK